MSAPIQSINHNDPISITEASDSNQDLSPQKAADLIEVAKVRFEEGQGQVLQGTGGLKVLKHDGCLFFGVKKEEQTTLDFGEVKSKILEQINLEPDTQIVQVVGDSAKFSLYGTKYCTEYLRSQLDGEKVLLLWGYTGHGRNGDPTLDVNQVTSSWIDEEPGRGRCSLANVVDLGTVNVIRKYNCGISSTNRQFYLVYGDANFGDDILSSDMLTDRAICFEGGVQSFRQAVNFLSRDIHISGTYNVRGANNFDVFNPETKQSIIYFSTGEFFSLLKEFTQKNPDASYEKITVFRDHYLEQRELYNRKRHDANTKRALFDEAWSQFIENELWKRLELCNFTKFENP